MSGHVTASVDPLASFCVEQSVFKYLCVGEQRRACLQAAGNFHRLDTVKSRSASSPLPAIRMLLHRYASRGAAAALRQSCAPCAMRSHLASPARRPAYASSRATAVHSSSMAAEQQQTGPAAGGSGRVLHPDISKVLYSETQLHECITRLGRYAWGGAWTGMPVGCMGVCMHECISQLGRSVRSCGGELHEGSLGGTLWRGRAYTPSPCAIAGSSGRTIRTSTVWL